VAAEQESARAAAEQAATREAAEQTANEKAKAEAEVAERARDAEAARVAAEQEAARAAAEQAAAREATVIFIANSQPSQSQSPDREQRPHSTPSSSTDPILTQNTNQGERGLSSGQKVFGQDVRPVILFKSLGCPLTRLVNLLTQLKYKQ
jgi:fused signal recognition particle receptor